MERRNTKQREIVLDAVMLLKNHATADEIYKYIKEFHPNIGKGTVYRNLNILSESGLIRKISIPNGPDHYDHCNSNDHYHVQCVRCNKLFDLDMELIKDLEKTVVDNQGFDILGYDLVFKGVCPECKNK